MAAPASRSVQGEGEEEREREREIERERDFFQTIHLTTMLARGCTRLEIGTPEIRKTKDETRNPKNRGPNTETRKLK
jgi:histone acetyltransferase (RNA polymerase elongator complex component)